MAVAVVEQPMTQLCHNFETMKIDAHRKAGDKAEFPISNQQLYPNYVGETFHSSASVASSDMIGDGTSSYCSREDYPELAYVTAPNGYGPSHGTIYTGCPSPVMNAHGYMPYPMDGMHYYNQIVDYNFTNQPVYGSVPTSVHYPAQGNDGFVYGPQVYQYPVQPYYQQPSVGQYVPASPSMPTGGMVMLEPQESSVVLTNGFNNYAGPIPAGPPVTFIPPVSCENPALPIAVSYPHLPAAHPSHTLRASAPAWIEPTHELKGGFKERKPVEVPSGPQLSAINGIYPPNKTGTTLPNNGVLSRSNSTMASVKLVSSPHPGPTPLSSHRVIDVKESTRPGTDKAVKKDLSFSAVASNGQDNGMQTKLHQFTKPLTVVPNKESCPCLPNGERYNAEDFVTKYDDAKHFIIKSYSEENVFRSIQYGVWASTPNGNKKLDDAYHDAQRRAAGKPRGCPIFLFFSVNGSRQFCGVAEMIGPIDYKRSMEFWEQHKWSGSFPLKWHFIKDVPNSQFRRIILPNNENKPVTNSRDTQEVFFQQGLEMLNIIKSYPARTSILDEFPLCNMPMKTAPDLRAQQPQQWSPQSFPKIGEQVVKVRNEETDVKSPRLTSTALKVCDNGAKITHLAKPILGKVTPATAGQEPNMDKERRRVDKENIKLAGKDGAPVAA